MYMYMLQAHVHYWWLKRVPEICLCSYIWWMHRLIDAPTYSKLLLDSWQNVDNTRVCTFLYVCSVCGTAAWRTPLTIRSFLTGRQLIAAICCSHAWRKSCKKKLRKIVQALESTKWTLPCSSRGTGSSKQFVVCACALCTVALFKPCAHRKWPGKKMQKV
jgi:hypothetical protein